MILDLSLIKTTVMYVAFVKERSKIIFYNLDIIQPNFLFKTNLKKVKQQGKVIENIQQKSLAQESLLDY